MDVLRLTPPPLFCRWILVGVPETRRAGRKETTIQTGKTKILGTTLHILGSDGDAPPPKYHSAFFLFSLRLRTPVALRVIYCATFLTHYKLGANTTHVQFAKCRFFTRETRCTRSRMSFCHFFSCTKQLCFKRVSCSPSFGSSLSG